MLSINYVYKELLLPYASWCAGIFLINAFSMYNMFFIRFVPVWMTNNISLVQKRGLNSFSTLQTACLKYLSKLPPLLLLVFNVLIFRNQKEKHTMLLEA